MEQSNPPLDLSRPRSVGELLSTAVQLFTHHASLFLSVTLLVVAPVVIFVEGVWGGALREGPDYSPSAAAAAVSALLTTFAIPSLVTALHAVIVRDLGSRGEIPTAGRALREAAPRMLAALGAVVASSIGIAIGFVCLIVPGIWLMVRWYFGAQAAVLDGTSPGVSLDRSSELVKGRWWETFRALLLSIVVFGFAGLIASTIVRVVEQPVVFVVLLTLVQAVALSISALFGTLLFFTLRARHAAAAAPPPLTTA